MNHSTQSQLPDKKWTRISTLNLRDFLMPRSQFIDERMNETLFYLPSNGSEDLSPGPPV